jgi:acyl carrier protein
VNPPKIEEKMTTDTIYPKVREIIADVLAFDEEEIQRDGSLVDDYGAESIDFLDLVYQLEREFKIKIPRGMIEQKVRSGLSDEEFEENGRLTDKGLEHLKAYLSEVPEERFTPRMQVTLIPTLFTPETFCKIVLREKEGGEQAASD